MHQAGFIYNEYINHFYMKLANIFGYGCLGTGGSVLSFGTGTTGVVIVVA
jgi:VanZ family protein